MEEQFEIRSDEWKFDKSLADLKTIHQLRLNYIRAFIAEDYRTATKWMICWQNSLGPMVKDYTNKKNKPMPKAYLERLTAARRKLDNYQDNPEKHTKSLFNNFLQRHEQFLLELEHELEIYFNKKPGGLEAAYAT